MFRCLIGFHGSMFARFGPFVFHVFAGACFLLSDFQLFCVVLLLWIICMKKRQILEDMSISEKF